jgi:predicted alpha/beta superfamily hydrolase
MSAPHYRLCIRNSQRIPPHRWLFLLLLGLLSAPGEAQVRHLTGQVLDADTQRPLPAATLRLLHLGALTTAAADGSFALPLPTSSAPDTLLVTCLGYAPQRVVLAPRPLQQPLRLLLRPQRTALGPVAVTARTWVERQVGITSARALVHFTDGTLPTGQPFEIAQRLRVGTAGTLVTAVHLHLAADQPDSLTLAVRFYQLVAERPGAPLSAQPIYRRVAVRQGWVRLDLGPQAVYLTQDAVLGLTLLPAPTARTPVPVEIKLGGQAQSFARSGPDVPWRVPPHHYRLFVTVRQPATAPVASNEADNQESVATTHLWAPTLGDSLALFVHLPRDYRPHGRRRYPLLLLLDGNVYAEQVGAALRRHPAREAAILVGVGRRTFLRQDSLRQRDYTYPAAPVADSLPTSGGGRAFLAFVEGTLLPYLDRSYRTDTTQRTLLGHSLGGYFTLWALSEALRTHRYSFATYVAASPTLLYADAYLLHELANAGAAAVAPPPLRVYLTSGTQELRASTEGRATRAAVAQLLTLLRGPAFANLRVGYHSYPGYRHLDTAVPTFTTRPAEWDYSTPAATP